MLAFRLFRTSLKLRSCSPLANSSQPANWSIASL
jgi:hypothetical protein